jgi:nucleotide-binding universal stress UspA family protein
VLPLLGAGATLHLVHVWRPIGMSDARTQLLDDAYRNALPDRFARFTNAIAIPPAVTVAYEVREGDPAERLTEFAEAHDADLIVAGRHGLGVVERILVGSVTTSVLRRAPCSLYVAPEPPFADADRFGRAMTGESTSVAAAEWPARLDAFTRRNARRRTTLESDLPLLGAETQETGFTFDGATYDPHDRRVELVFAGAGGRGAHLTRSLAGVVSVTVLSCPRGADDGLRIDHQDGLTLLRFLPA